MKQTNHYTAQGMSIGMCLGMAVGTAIGSARGEISIGMTLGLSCGMCLGLAVGRSMDNRINAQREKADYHITEIQPREDGTVRVTIENQKGEKQQIALTQAAAQSLQTGDAVSLTEEGQLEKIL